MSDTPKREPNPVVDTSTRNVIAANSSASMVDKDGVLLYRGYSIGDLGTHAIYEEVAYLMWYGKLPNRAELEAFQVKSAALRAIPERVTAILRLLPAHLHPMAVLRTAVSALSADDEDADNLSQSALQGKALYLMAVMPTIVAAWERIRNGKQPIEPRSDLGHVANFLYMLNGEEADEATVKAMEVYFVCLVDHEMNASTFSGRVAISTKSDIYSAVTAALGTLKGVLHGGANQEAMEMFMSAEASGDVDAWYHAWRAEGKLVMGVGHPVYRAPDPRSRVFNPFARKMAENHPQGHWYRIAERIDELVHEDPYFVERNLHPNVDYYSSIILYMIGVPVDLMTCVFALSRIVGWTTHMMEQLKEKLIRPKANYIGPWDEPFVSLEERL